MYGQTERPSYILPPQPKICQIKGGKNFSKLMTNSKWFWKEHGKRAHGIWMDGRGWLKINFRQPYTNHKIVLHFKNSMSKSMSKNCLGIKTISTVFSYSKVAGCASIKKRHSAWILCFIESLSIYTP